ncbi:MAG: hypothetical protein ABIS50_18145 [Luteolibacter sp.]|uniref:hypothetical protein n=1 Tax=Luteolibacter sp. TaxID=1962973 RepID=UPI003263B7D6
MAKKRKPSGRGQAKNQRREPASFAGFFSSANRRAHEQANRRGGKRDKKFVWSVMSTTDFDDGIETAEWLKRVMRWSLALLLLPLCWVTTWTFLSRFSHATLDQDFWRTAEFWYFATGALVMVGWFWSGLLQSFFLYLYVLGHELTHAVFVLLYRGKVTDFHVSVDGGYITTNKTNLVIALSPYFVPFWAVVSAVVYAAVRYFGGIPQEWDRLLYGLMGVTWTFHMVWTLWMIPRDQPDLKENGTFLSLVIIYLANLLVLVGLLCVAGHSPLQSGREFGLEWLRFAATWGDAFVRWVNVMIAEFRQAAML